jgi:ABC-type transport system involved in Fe-S cluster assembly fused permease/ATPase subunit
MEMEDARKSHVRLIVDIDMVAKLMAYAFSINFQMILVFVIIIVSFYFFKALLTCPNLSRATTQVQ